MMIFVILMSENNEEIIRYSFHSRISVNFKMKTLFLLEFLLLVIAAEYGMSNGNGKV